MKELTDWVRISGAPAPFFFFFLLLIKLIWGYPISAFYLSFIVAFPNGRWTAFGQLGHHSFHYGQPFGVRPMENYRPAWWTPGVDSWSLVPVAARLCQTSWQLTLAPVSSPCRDLLTWPKYSPPSYPEVALFNGVFYFPNDILQYCRCYHGAIWISDTFIKFYYPFLLPTIVVTNNLNCCSL